MFGAAGVFRKPPGIDHHNVDGRFEVVDALPICSQPPLSLAQARIRLVAPGSHR
jgi:hypothetical protein